MKNKTAEQPRKIIIPEINITQQQEQEQQRQQQQNGQQNEEILGAWKRPESYKIWVAQPFEQRPEKNNEMPPPPAAPSKPKSFKPSAKSVMDARVAKKKLNKKQASKKN